MKVLLEFEIGNTTCASEPGKFCRFVRISLFGTNYSCALFTDFDRAPYPLFDNDSGWLARCPQCLEVFPPEEENI